MCAYLKSPEARANIKTMSILSRAPYITRRLASHLKPLLRLQFGLVVRTLKLDMRTARDALAVRRAGIFNPGYYAATSPDAKNFAGGLLLHYLDFGGFEGRRPHPLFDSAWYLDTYPDVRERGTNPLVHYILIGSAEARNPNPYLDTAWYASLNPGLSVVGGAPLRHYIEQGTTTGIDPSPRFRASWYLAKNPDVAKQGTPALEHFLLAGEKEGRAPNPEAAQGTLGKPVTDAIIEYRKSLSYHREIALFVTHSPHGKLKPHVLHYVEALRRNDIAVFVIVAADRPWFDDDAGLLDQVDGLAVRQNQGYDFAAWAHLLLLEPQFLDAERLYFLNDSLIGPLNERDFSSLIARLRADPAGVVGLTANSEHRWHIQSYFLALRQSTLASSAFQLFMRRIVTLPEKDDVIQHYEITFAPEMKTAGIACSVLFPSPSEVNATIFNWRWLIDQGFPFVKVMTLRDSFPGVDTSGWQDVVKARGFDASIAEKTLDEVLAPAIQLRPSLFKSKIPERSRLKGELDGVYTPPRVIFLGPWNYSNGLAIASRSYLSALRHTSFELNLTPIQRPFHIHRRIAPPFDISSFAGPADVSIIHLNPDGWPGLMTSAQSRTLQCARLRVGLWVWETNNIPDNWFPMFDEVDAIWTPSRYCAEVFAQRAKVPVHVIPHVITPQENTPTAENLQRTKHEIGLLPEDKVILYAFDGASYLVRKNPFALVRAFSKSGLAQRGWRLVLKTKHLFDSKTQGELLHEQAHATPGVLLLNTALDQESMRNLMAIADIYASPHCSEGFGLTVAEAMVLGKMVVATDYSGTRDFLDASCGFPVRYTLEELQETHGHYVQGDAWAKIDEAHLCACLLQAADLIGRGDESLGNAARNRILETLSARAVGALIQQSIEQLMTAIPEERTP